MTTYEVCVYQIYGCGIPYFNGSAYKLAVFDGWAQLVDGWALFGDGRANARPGPPLATPVFTMSWI